MARIFFWKVWLRLNRLTKDVKNDYVAEVSTVGHTVSNEDVAKAIKKEGSDLQLETLIDVFNRGDRIRRNALLNGSSVQDGNVHLAPRVTGNWIGTDPQFDPESHKITVDAVPTAELRRALEEVGVEVLGKKADGGAHIGLVTDLNTGKTDGTISRNGDIIITGEKIKIAPDGEAGLGVFFVTAGGAETQDSNPLVQNDPKKIVCRVPNLPEGPFTLKIVTCFTSGNILLKEPAPLSMNCRLIRNRPLWFPSKNI
ncbi:MAG: DUF4469 domain-containing protein [Prevotellaceae bacterium]|jgi:hypothetical protein|nr:DUF4469 domain-containing protein [Prevotellaceae bacterium]